MEYVVLSNGIKMPQLGYGVYQIDKKDCEKCVLNALSVGYRHIDTAQSYFNEEEVGNAIFYIERMKENFDIFDFSLSDDEMKLMTTLDKNQSSFFSHSDPNIVEWLVKMVEERKHNDGNNKENKNR